MKCSTHLAAVLISLTIAIANTGCVPPGKDLHPDEPIRAPFGNRNESAPQSTHFSDLDHPTLFTIPEFISIEEKLKALGCKLDTQSGVEACPLNGSLEEADELLVTLRAFRAARMKDRELLKDEKLSYLVSRSSTAQIDAIEASAPIVEVRKDIYRLRSESHLVANVAGDMDVELSYLNRLEVSKLVKALSEEDRFNELLSKLDVGLVVMSDVTRLDQPDLKRQLKIKYNDSLENVLSYLTAQSLIHGDKRSTSLESERLRGTLRLSHNLYMTQLSEDSKVKGLELLASLANNPRFAELLYLNNLDYIVMSSRSRVEKNLNFRFLRIDFNSSADEVMQTLEAAAAESL